MQRELDFFREFVRKYGDPTDSSNLRKATEDGFFEDDSIKYGKNNPKYKNWDPDILTLEDFKERDPWPG